MLIDLIFYLINFVLFVAIAQRIFKRTVVGRVRHQIMQQYSYKQQLVTERDRLRSLQKEKERELHEQERICQSLQKKIEQWRGAVEELAYEQEKERIRLQETLEKKIQKQQELISLTDIQRKVTPYVIADLSQEMSSHYSDASHQQAYIQYIVDFMRKP